MIRLVAITPPPIAGIATRTIRCDQPTALSDWRALVRGPAVFLVSPPGWTAGAPAAARDAKGKRQAYEVARSACVLHWEADEDGDVDKLQSHTSQAFGTREALDDAALEAELERQTAPKQARKP